MIDYFLGDAFGVCPARLEYCSAVWCSAADTHLKLLNRAVSWARFIIGMCMSVILLIVNLWQYCACCIRSGITRCTLLMVLYLDRMCLCGLIAVLWYRYTYAPPRWRISQHRRTFFPPLSVLLERSWWPRLWWCWTGGFQEQGQCFHIGLSGSIPTVVFYYFSLSLLSVYGLV